MRVVDVIFQPVLRLVPDDKDALDSKLFLLIQTDQYEAALELIKELPGPSDSSHLFEQAYLLYRLQKEDEAAEMVKRAQEAGEYDEPRALSNLEAQIVSQPRFVRPFKSVLCVSDREMKSRTEVPAD